MRTNTILVAVIALLVGILIGTYTSMALRADAQERNSSGALRARSITLTDETGKARVTISGGTSTEHASILILARNGKRGVMLSDGPDGPDSAASVSVFNNNGDLALHFSGNDGAPRIAIAGKSNKIDLMLGSLNGVGYCVTADSSGQEHKIFPK